MFNSATHLQKHRLDCRYGNDDAQCSIKLAAVHHSVVVGPKNDGGRLGVC